MNKTFKIILFIFIFLVVIVGVWLSVLAYFNYKDYSHINEASDYKIFIKSEVIDELNKEYTQTKEKWFCVDGEVDDSNREITIESLSPVPLIHQSENKAFSRDRYPCEGYIGQIHTHPKLFGFMPLCYFSDTDIYTWGELSGKLGHRIAGVYCDEDKIAFYVSGSQYDGTVLLNNSRIDYEVI